MAQPTFIVVLQAENGAGASPRRSTGEGRARKATEADAANLGGGEEEAH